MTDRLAGHLRVAATLGVLALFFLFAVTRGLDAVSKPFPKGEDPPVCVETALKKNDILRVAGVTVNVVNAGSKSGLARTTLTDLEERGFAGGTVANQPDPDVRSVEVRDAGGKTPAARLVRTYLGGTVRIVEDPDVGPGVTVVVADGFAGVREGRGGLRITEPASVCGPPGL